MGEAGGPNLGPPDDKSPEKCGNCGRTKSGHPKPYGKDTCQLEPIDDGNKDVNDSNDKK